MESPEELTGPSEPCAVAPDKVYGLLQTSRKGLSTEEAAKRLATYGDNVLTAKKPIPMWRRFAVHLLNMFAILLWVASALSFASDQAALGGAVILVILINAVFAFVQEYRAEKAIEALKNMLPPKAKVIRDGQLQEIEARMLVPGDAPTPPAATRRRSPTSRATSSPAAPRCSGRAARSSTRLAWPPSSARSPA